MKIKNLLVSAMVALGLFLTLGLNAEASNGKKSKVAEQYYCDYSFEQYCGHKVSDRELNNAKAKQDASAYITTEKCKYANPNYCGDNSLTNGLESNQTTLFYMYSDKNGYYMIDPLADFENIIFIEKHDMPKFKGKLYTGKRFIGTFEDNTLWGLIRLEEVVYN